MTTSRPLGLVRPQPETGYSVTTPIATRIPKFEGAQNVCVIVPITRTRDTGRMYRRRSQHCGSRELCSSMRLVPKEGRRVVLKYEIQNLRRKKL